jgi:hypothetical protein
MGGGKGSEGAGMETMAPYINDLMGKGNKIWKEATPLRESMLGQFGGFLGLPIPQRNQKTTQSYWNKDYVDPTGNVVPRWETVVTETPVSGSVQAGRTGAFPDAYMPYFQNQKLNIEKNFNQAADLAKGMISGGSQDRALTDLVSNRAGNLSNTYGNISQDILNKLWGFSTGTGISSPLQAGTSAMSGAIQAGQLENQLYSSQQNQKQGKGAGMGGLMGSFFGPMGTAIGSAAGGMAAGGNKQA